jgi:putative nucleotidyltransferase with HDIG domain
LDTYVVIPLIEIVFCLALLGLLVVRGRHHVARKSFGLFLVFMALWGVFIFLMRFTPDLSTAAFWENFVFGSILSAALSFYWFTMNFTGSKLNKIVFLTMAVAYLLVLCLIPTGWIFRGMQIMWYGKAPIIAPLFPLYVLCVYVPLAFSMLALLKNTRHCRNNDERTRNQYIVVGMVAMFVGGTTDYLPAIGLNLYPLGIIGNILFCILATIAMLRYGLLEIRAVLRKGAAYSLISIMVLGTFGSLILILTTVFQNTLNPFSLTLTITAVFLIAAIFQPVLLKSQHVVDRWFFRQRYDYLQALKRFANDQEGELDLHQISESLVTTVANSMQSSGVYLLLPHSTTREFVTVAYGGKKNQGGITLAPSAPLVVTLKYHDGIIDGNDMDVLPALNSLAENDRKPLEDNQIELTMALKNGGQLTGILLIGGKVSGDPYSNEDKRLLQSVSEDIAARIENASRFDNIKKAHSELQRTMDGVISAVSAVVESRDPYTAGHQRRVAELAQAIASEMGLTEWQMKGMHIIGLLHDVGKIAVPAEILSKPGKISQFEFNIIKNHSRVGFEILEKVDFPWPVARAILQHHERLNGSGYPEGVAHNEIILEAKILGVADVVEAMSSHRPYRPALGLESALEEIRKQSGILYDPEVVDACLRLLNNRQFAFDKLMSAAENPRESSLQGVCSK